MDIVTGLRICDPLVSRESLSADHTYCTEYAYLPLHVHNGDTLFRFHCLEKVDRHPFILAVPFVKITKILEIFVLAFNESQWLQRWESSSCCGALVRGTY
jgi:hypothetical protein